MRPESYGFETMLDELIAMMKSKNYDDAGYGYMLEEGLMAACYAWTKLVLEREDKEITLHMFKVLGITGQKYLDNIKRLECEKN